jgi:hypothetical protein
MFAFSAPVFPFTETNTPSNSKLLVEPAVNVIPVVGVTVVLACGVPKPTTTVPLLLVTKLIPTFPPAQVAPPVKSPVQLIRRMPVVAEG